jgi:hypothetical protein
VYDLKCSNTYPSATLFTSQPWSPIIGGIKRLKLLIVYAGGENGIGVAEIGARSVMALIIIKGGLLMGYSWIEQQSSKPRKEATNEVLLRS